MAEVIYLFEDRAGQSQADSQLVACTPILVWFPFFGRNAWNATWVNRYRGGSFQISRKAAEDYIAKRLKQGSNWGFQVLPAFYMQFSDCAYLLTEINTNAPFGNLNSVPPLKPGTKKATCLDALCPASPYWRPGQRRENGIILQQTKLSIDACRRYEDRTEEPNRIWTIATYKRVKHEFGDWLFEATSLSIELSAFEVVARKIENSGVR